jgi:hypothetical protein
MNAHGSHIVLAVGAVACCVGCGDGATGPRADSARVYAATIGPASGGPHVPPLVGAEPRQTPRNYTQDVVPLIETYCIRCHDTATASGNIVLDEIGADIRDQTEKSVWLRVAESMRSRDMPPEGEPAPSPAELEIINSWLDEILSVAAPSRAPVTVRRLNRVEYNNTIRDLIGLDLHPADEFPGDDLGFGFDNNAEVLSTSPLLAEMYLDAADRLITRAFNAEAARERIMNPSVDAVPRAFRKYKPPVRSFKEKDRAVPRAPTPDPELLRSQRIYDILRAFADRAFRRPATHEELMRLLAMVESAEKDGETLEQAIQVALRAILVSPHFLFRIEEDLSPPDPSVSTPPNDFAFASRLAYFLWSSMPDEELFRIAAQGELRSPSNLKSQVQRMLRDSRAGALSKHFGNQWLQTRKVTDLTPDPVLFPAFDDALRTAMLRETELFLVSIQSEDRSVLELIDGEFTFVNGRLARHYGIPGVEGEQFRRVSLKGSPRSGIITHASVLAATSNPTRTSPVKRGKWILENILGVSPSPPPSGVEALKDGPDGPASGTLRDRMQRHRTDPNCASCHRRMDPLGFSLENFDAIGAWRNHDGGTPIDSSGRLSGGKTFQGPEGLRSVISSRKDAFLRCLTEKMLMYAMGRGLERNDRRAVNEIVARVARDEYRFSALVMSIVESQPFQENPRRQERP